MRIFTHHLAHVHPRWVQLSLGLIAMMSISSPQYVWTLFARHFQDAIRASPSEIQITFFMLIALQTFLSPMHAYLVEKFGARVLVAIGVGLSGLGWIISADAHSLCSLYLTYGVFCGIGTGIVYVGIVGLMARWFPNRRGFAIGTVAAGYGMGAMMTTFPIHAMIHNEGYRAALVFYGFLLALIGIVAAMGLRTPGSGETGSHHGLRISLCGQDKGPNVMLKTPIFWLMFAMMTMMSSGGLMVTSNFSYFFNDFGATRHMLLGMSSLPLALTLDRLLNGFTRPFFGWISDHFGRENTMALAFILEAAAIGSMVVSRNNVVALVLLSGVVFFAWGEIFSLFPAVLTETFGETHATRNYGFLYMSQGVGSLLGGPIAAYLRAYSTSWLPVFAMAIVFDLLTAILALFILKPLRKSYIEKIDACGSAKANLATAYAHIGPDYAS